MAHESHRLLPRSLPEYFLILEKLLGTVQILRDQRGGRVVRFFENDHGMITVGGVPINVFLANMLTFTRYP